MSAAWELVFGLGKLGVTRWLEKPPVPSAAHAQEPKTRVVPSGTLLAVAPSYIYDRRVSVFTTKPAHGYP